MNKLLICEILQKTHSAKTKAEKVKILRNNNSQALRTIFIINFDESVVPRVPLGEDIPYTPNEAPMGTEHTNLLVEAKNAYYYFKGGAENLSNMKIESMFIRMLEGLYRDDAIVFIKAVNKSLHKKYRITKAVVEEAFPEINWGNRS